MKLSEKAIKSSVKRDDKISSLFLWYYVVNNNGKVIIDERLLFASRIEQ